MGIYNLNILENSELIIKDFKYKESIDSFNSDFIISQQIFSDILDLTKSPIRVAFLEFSPDNEVNKKYNILDEEFDISYDDNKFIISHPLWSLTGIGNSLIEAERDLLIEASEAYHYYSKYSNSELSEEAIEMKEFLQKIV